MKTVIVAGGRLTSAFLKANLEREERYIIACDRGMDLLLEAGVKPDLLLGDFDSTARPDRVGRLEKDGVPVEVYPWAKDFSDLESAIRHAVDLGSEDILILGATGGRQDHFLAALYNLLIPLEAGIPARILDEQNEIFLMDRSFSVVRKGTAFEDSGKPYAFTGKTFISLMPVLGAVSGITLTGFRFPGENLTLDPLSASLGISNRLVSDVCTVDFKEGVLAVIFSDDKKEA